MAERTMKPIYLSRPKRLKPGIHAIAGTKGASAITIEGCDFDLDLTGVHVQGSTGRPWEFEGTGISLRDCRNVTVRGARVSGYRRGIELRGCRGVTLIECDTSDCYDQQLKSTPERYDPADWVDIFHREVWETYGYGVYVVDSADCRVRACTSKRGQNGVALVCSSDCTVEDCDVSRNTGWGVWMHNASDNRIVGNNADWCVRCESKQYSAGGDAAGVMLSDNCCRNVIAHNTMRSGGDGFFLNGLWVKESTDNLVAFNDMSHSPHNAIESSWSARNVFVGNIASNSRYGMWLGLSYHNRVIGNVIEHNLFDGIAIEHAHHNVIAGNLIRRCRNGIRLLARQKLLPPSHHYEIHGNIIEQCRVAALAFSRTIGAAVTGNQIARSKLPIRFDTKCRRIEVARNNFLGGAKPLAELGDSEAISLDDNFWDLDRAKAVLARITVNKRSAVTLERVARKRFASPRRPAVVAHGSKAAARDTSFRWYAELEHLVGL
ncbi:MAG: right-handed parallel beta-helix repeat-containing protein [Verrucomicrobia bacterium]|nr:right-handed parallel beta-helix repeat-containing protein [Verrucomicrobiota bacterium]